MHLTIKGSILIPLILEELLPLRCRACRQLPVFGVYVQVRQISSDESSSLPDSSVSIVSSVILVLGDSGYLPNVNEQPFTNCPVSIHDVILRVISYKLEVSLQVTNTLDLLSSQNLYGSAATCTAPLNGTSSDLKIRWKEKIILSSVCNSERTNNIIANLQSIRLSSQINISRHSVLENF